MNQLHEVRKHLIRARAFHEASAALADAGEIRASRMAEAMYARAMAQHDEEVAAYEALFGPEPETLPHPRPSAVVREGSGPALQES